MPPRIRLPLALAFALGLPAAVVLLELLLVPQPGVAPFVLLFLAVAATSWVGGTGPGLVATLVSAALGNYVFIEPSGGFNLSGPGLLATLLFLPSAAGVAVVAGSLRRTAQSLREALREVSEKSSLARRFELLAENARDVVLMIRAEDGRILEANAAALKAYGYPREELLRLSLGDLRAPETLRSFTEEINRARERGLLFETIHLRKDGTAFPVEVSSQSGVIDGAPALISVIRDISERRSAERSLREAEQQVRARLESILAPSGDLQSLELQDLVDAPALQALLESFHELTRIPASIIDTRGKVLVGVGWQAVCTQFHRADPRTCAHCIESDTELTAGIRPGEFRLYRCKNNMWDAATPLVVGGKHVGNVFTGQFFFEDEQPDLEAFRAQARQYGFAEDPYLRALERVPRLSREAVRSGMGFLVVLAQTLSKLGYANVKLARALKQGEVLADSLREGDRRKNQFIAMLSHELRNPLAPVRNGLYLLQRAEPGSEQARRALAIIERQTAHLGRLVEDLLEVTRVVHGKVELRRTVLVLNDLVRSVAEDNRPAFAARGLELLVEVAQEPLRVDGDPTRLAQALGNLLQNAAKFTDRGSAAVVLSREADSGRAVLRVRDTGVGISPDVLPRLFQPFMQADTGLDRSRGGLGLGLAVARSMLELHGGTLSASSAGLGKGAEFVVRLPLARQPGAEPVAIHTVARHGRRVLVVEDVADSAESLREVLELNGHVVEVARDGVEGLQKAKAFRPEVVLCDIGLPVMDGYAVARSLRKDDETSGAYLVALTGYGQPDDRRRAMEAGFDTHVCKPPEVGALMRLVGTAPAAAAGAPAGR